MAKAELLKEELEESTLLFQSLQDSLATEMFSFVAGEQSYAQAIAQVSLLFIKQMFLKISFFLYFFHNPIISAKLSLFSFLTI